MVAPFYTPSSKKNAQGFQFLQILCLICLYLFSGLFAGEGWLVVVVNKTPKWSLIQVLNCSFLMTSDIEYLFVHVSICIHSLEKCLFKSFTHVSIGSPPPFFCYSVAGILIFYILSLSQMCFGNIFFHSVSALLSDSILQCTKVLKLIKSNLSIFLLLY